MSTPLLSLVVPARNDSYMGDFTWRFSTCLNYLARNLQRLGRLADVEMVVCDWNSDVPLHHALNLSPLARQITRFVVVPPAVARPAQGDSAFPIVIAQNVAIRRARGRFVGQTDSDILFTERTLRALLAVLDGVGPDGPAADRMLMFAGRRHLPWELCLRRPTLAQFDDYIERCGERHGASELSTGLHGATGICLLPAETWAEVQGYDERLVHWGWMEIDLHLRLNQKYGWVDLTNQGVVIFHMEHYPRNDRTAQPRPFNQPTDPVAFAASGPQWGLAGHDFDVVSGSDLAGAVLPVDGWADSLAERVGETGDEDAVREAIVQPAVWERVLDACARVPFLEEQARQADRTRGQFSAATALAWYASTFQPLDYLELGPASVEQMLAVAYAAPACEIISATPPGSGKGCRTEAATFLLDCVRHRGDARFLLGDLATAQQRLWASRNRDVDLVHVNGSAFATQDAALEQLCEAADHLRPGGALVYACDATFGFLHTWNQFRLQCPGFRCVHDRPAATGLALRVE